MLFMHYLSLLKSADSHLSLFLNMSSVLGMNSCYTMHVFSKSSPTIIKAHKNIKLLPCGLFMTFTIRSYSTFRKVDAVREATVQ